MKIQNGSLKPIYITNPGRSISILDGDGITSHNLSFNPLLSSDAPIIFDSFNRSDTAASMGNAETGQIWVPGVGIWGINSNQAYLAVHGGVECNIAIDTGEIAYSVSCKLTAGGATGGLITNYFDSASFVKIILDGTNIYVDRYIASAWARLATIAGITWSDGDILRVDISGTDWTVYQNGILKGNNNNIPLGLQGFTKVGLDGYNSSAFRWNDFQVKKK